MATDNSISPNQIIEVDVLIIGAGAAGLMCALTAGARGRKVLVIDHANKVGKKILMSGGGRCNFTNYYIEPTKYLSHNPHFCKSALSCYSQWDFIALVEKHGIAYHEKKAGQLFCDGKAKAIVTMLLDECAQVGAQIKLHTSVNAISARNGYEVRTSQGLVRAKSLVIATGGLSIPTMGATPFGYQVAEQFGLKLWPTRAGLVPFTMHPDFKARFESLSGVSTPATVTAGDMTFTDDLLFTHRGLSGPAILQISSYWEASEPLTVNLLPTVDLEALLSDLVSQQSRVTVAQILENYLPKRLVSTLVPEQLFSRKCVTLSKQERGALVQALQYWTIKPAGTEGYRTAEVTLGGVDVNALSSKTLEVKTQAGLYFIGEVVDVTGWLGGYNFQWAWSSAVAAGRAV